MKKLFVLIAAAAFIAPASVFAQDTKVTTEETEDTITITEETPTATGKVVTTTVIEKKSVFTNGFWHNWQLSAGLGTQMFYGDNDWKVAKKVPEMFVFPAIDLYLTKWASPSFGVGLGANWAPFKGLYQSTPRNAANPNGVRYAQANFIPSKVEYYTKANKDYDSQNLAVQAGSYLNIFALAHADLMNIFGGYKADRFFDIDAYAGGGAIFGFCDSGNVHDVSFNAGLMNTFRLTEQLRLLLNIRGALIGDAFDGESYLAEPTKEHWLKNHKFDGMFGATLGLTYNIGKDYSKWRLAERSSVYQYDKELIEKIIKDTVYVDVPGPIEVPEVWFHINFVIDRWDLSKKELVNINAVADLIKSTPNTKYLVCGYADKQTATPAHNLMLSENRANAVYDALVNEFGVNPQQLVKDWKGGVDYMFYNMKELSRCAMITSIKEP